MRLPYLLPLVLLAGVAAAAGPPAVTVPAEVKGDVANFVTVKATATDAKVVKFLALDPGLSVFPASLLADQTATVVVASRPGKYRLLAYAGNADGPSDPVITTVVISGPLPPGPGPGPDPVDPPGPEEAAPIREPGFRVMIVYDSSAGVTLPAAQVAVFTSADVRTYANRKCALGADGVTKEFRVFASTQDVSGESKVWRDAMNLKRASLPWIVVSTGKTGYSGPLPKDVNATLDLLKKYGGQ